MNPPATTITGGKRPGSQLDPDHGAQKLPRRMDSPAGGVPRTPMSSQTPGTLATSPETGIDHGGDAVAVLLNMELEVPLLVQQRRWRSVCRMRTMGI